MRCRKRSAPVSVDGYSYSRSRRNRRAKSKPPDGSVRNPGISPRSNSTERDLPWHDSFSAFHHLGPSPEVAHTRPRKGAKAAMQTQDGWWRLRMRFIPLSGGMFLIASIGNAAFAQSCVGDQKPAPLDVIEQMTLPLCDFAATQSWGPKGCRWCDARDMYPNPFGTQAVPQNEAGRFRGLPEIN
jgi:hypothetical protein